MNKKIMFNNVFILKLFCYFREAERTLDRAIFSDWSEILEYYSNKKRRDVIDILNSLEENLIEAKISETSLIEPITTNNFVNVSLIDKLIFHMFLNKIKSEFEFPVEYILCFFNKLKNLSDLISLPSKPENHILISLRLDMNLCLFLIKKICSGMPGLKHAEKIEHFQSPENIKMHSMEYLLGKWGKK